MTNRTPMPLIACIRTLFCWRSTPAHPALYRSLLVILMLSLNTSPSSAGNQEEQLRAAVIGGILRYTQWQDSASKTLCSLGAPSSEDILLKSAHRVKANNQSISILKVSHSEQIKACQILVIGRVPKDLAPSLKQQLNSGKVLSICDGCQDKKWTTNITLIRHKNNIRFDVDITHTKTNAITFSASLLELALSIRGQHNE